MKMLKFVTVIVLAFCIITSTCYAQENIYDNSEQYESNDEFVQDAQLIAKLLYRECRGVPSMTQRAAVAWVVLNRVDSEQYPNSVEEVILQKNQFASINNPPVTEELYDLAADVMMRHKWEKMGFTDVGRIIPEEYLWFAGKHGINTFRNRFSTPYRWDFSLKTPYID